MLYGKYVENGIIDLDKTLGALKIEDQTSNKVIEHFIALLQNDIKVCTIKCSLFFEIIHRDY